LASVKSEVCYATSHCRFTVSAVADGIIIIIIIIITTTAVGLSLGGSSPYTIDVVFVVQEDLTSQILEGFFFYCDDRLYRNWVKGWLAKESGSILDMISSCLFCISSRFWSPVKSGGLFAVGETDGA
jgi:hypothetical protein